MYIKPLKIGNLELKNNIILAPMAGVTDKPFRIICKEMGVGLTVTEMISSKAVFYNDSKTKKLYNLDGEEGPIAIQLFGSDLEAIKYATEEVSKLADIIDFNMGCPAPKIVKNGDGSRLLLDLDLVEKIVRTIRNNTDKPITFKIRKGWDENNIVAVEVAKVIEKAGADAITIHGRTRKEFYSGKADWDIIKQVKENVSIPVIGNGDIIDEESAEKMFEYTNVDGIMVGRAAFGNPWIFKEIIYYLQNGKKMEKPTLDERFNVMMKHIEMEVQEKNEEVAVKEMRKQLSWYIKSLKDSSHMRDKINKIATKEELINEIKQYFEYLKNN